MNRETAKHMDEYDVVTGWRKHLCWTHRPGACKKVKKRMNRRNRREWKMNIDEENES